MDLEQNRYLSIDAINKDIYRRSVEEYFGHFDGQKHEFQPDLEKSTLTNLGSLSEKTRQQVQTFSQNLVSLIPSDVITNLGSNGASSEKLKAAVACAYTVDTNAQENQEVRDNYIRVLSALSGYIFDFSNDSSQHSEQVLQDFLPGKVDRNTLTNFFINFCVSTQPIADYGEDRVTEKERKFDIFLGKTKDRVNRALNVFEQYYKRQFPYALDRISDWSSIAIFVDKIETVDIYTNDPKINAQSKYMGLSAGGAAFGVNQETGLPLILLSIPYDYDEVDSDKKLEPKDDPAYKKALFIMHEHIHNAPPTLKEDKSDWDSLINELITDTTAHILVLKSDGRQLQTTDDLLGIKGGYINLVKFGQCLVQGRFFTEDEIVSFGLSQNPEKFIQTLGERITNSKPEDVSKLFLKMMRIGLVLPRYSYEHKSYIDRLHKNPEDFMKTEFMAMWNKIGGSYFGGMKVYPASIFWELRNRHPEMGERDFHLMYDHKTDVFTDEAVKIFNGVFRETPFYSGLVKEKVLEDYIRDHSDLIDLSNADIPQNLRIDFDENQLRLKLLNSMSKILYDRLPYETREWLLDERIKTLVETTNQAYSQVSKLLASRWGSQNISFTRDDVISLLTQIIPFKMESMSKRTDNISEIIQQMVGFIDGLTAAVDIDGDEKTPGPRQSLYWGQAVKFES